MWLVKLLCQYLILILNLFWFDLWLVLLLELVVNKLREFWVHINELYLLRWSACLQIWNTLIKRHLLTKDHHHSFHFCSHSLRLLHHFIELKLEKRWNLGLITTSVGIAHWLSKWSHIYKMLPRGFTRISIRMHLCKWSKLVLTPRISSMIISMMLNCHQV